jgi:acetolactate synthase-1/2/3 large subunit
MKLSDYVADFLARRGVRDIFLVSGGGIMHLLDSVGRHPDLRYYCNYHEQASAVSAEGYARIRGDVGVCLVTVGPGAANALSGILGAWYDSVPLLVLSGQVRQDLIADYAKVRQIGPQEGNIVEMARPVTKYATTVRDPSTIRSELERAFSEARDGRPGPVWLDLPLDVQGSEVDPSSLAGYDPPGKSSGGADVVEAATRVLREIAAARRPIFVLGAGIHASRSEELLERVLERLPVPIVLPDMGKDLVPEDHPSYVGVFGTAGQRRANFAIQNADLVVSLAAGLSCKKIGFNYKGFAPKARKIVLDIDEGQLHSQVIRPDVAIQADVHDFLSELLIQVESFRWSPDPRWIEACRSWRERYPIILDDYFRNSRFVNSYVFMDRLSDALGPDDILVAGNGLDTVSYIQAFRVKRGQRTITSGNWGSMGWDLPLAIGACIGRGRARTTCVTGDGSLQWNVQELLTIGNYRLPIKIFVFNNEGYASIRATQSAFFEGRFVGSGPTSGVANPDFARLADAYHLAYDRIGENSEIADRLPAVLASDTPTLCEVRIAPEQTITPKASAFRREDGTFESRPLEDMAPFLPREEIWENMHLFDDSESPFRQ